MLYFVIKVHLRSVHAGLQVFSCSGYDFCHRG